MSKLWKKNVVVMWALRSGPLFFIPTPLQVWRQATLYSSF